MAEDIAIFTMHGFFCWRVYIKLQLKVSETQVSCG